MSNYNCNPCGKPLIRDAIICSECAEHLSEGYTYTLCADCGKVSLVYVNMSKPEMKKIFYTKSCRSCSSDFLSSNSVDIFDSRENVTKNKKSWTMQIFQEN